MKNTLHLIRLAQKLSNKYAQAQTLKEIIENAAGFGENSANGIMNFPDQLEKDDAGLTIVVTITQNPWGSKKVSVGPANVDPIEAAGNYVKLPEQIKKYLEKNINSFPQLALGHALLEFPKRVKSDSEIADEYLATGKGREYLKSLR